jgi:hypothetical protein
LPRVILDLPLLATSRLALWRWRMSVGQVGALPVGSVPAGWAGGAKTTTTGVHRAMPRPYQPSLLRFLHGATAVLAVAAWVSGFFVYNRFDGRWGRIPLLVGGDWIDLHGSLAVVLWPLALVFVVYAVTLGRSRLRHPANLLALLALSLAVGSGKLMQEDWLRNGVLNQGVYAVHLLAWLMLAAAVSCHVAVVLRRGGAPLALSMASLTCRPRDLPGDWLGQIRHHFSR